MMKQTKKIGLKAGTGYYWKEGGEVKMLPN
jgi:hypothetical protein